MDGVPPKANVPRICHAYPTMMKLGTSIAFLKKSLMNHVTHRLSSADIINFNQKSTIFTILRNTSIDWILMHNFFFFLIFLESFEIVFIKKLQIQ